jgi:tetratricopeptide (TPR) repeat protein
VLKRFTEALAGYDRAIGLRPNFAAAHQNRGNTLYDLLRFEEALGAHDWALALRPDLADAHSDRGNALRELVRFEEALESYTALSSCNRALPRRTSTERTP